MTQYESGVSTLTLCLLGSPFSHCVSILKQLDADIKGIQVWYDDQVSDLVNTSGDANITEMVTLQHGRLYTANHPPPPHRWATSPLQNPILVWTGLVINTTKSCWSLVSIPIMVGSGFWAAHVNPSLRSGPHYEARDRLISSRCSTVNCTWRETTV